MQAPATPSVASPETPIILVGASVRSAAESARRAGYRVYAVDRFGDRETRAAAERWFSLEATKRTFPDDLRSVASTARIAIVGGLCDEYVGHSAFIGASPSAFQESDCPVFLANLARDARVHFPVTTTSLPASRGPWLVKRTASCGGLGVTTLTSETPRELLAGSYIQRRERGRVVGASFLGCRSESRLLGVCGLLTKRLENRPFVFAGAVGPIPIRPTALNQIRALGDAFVTRCRIDGPFNIDVVVNHDRVTLLEVNPRWSASMELLEASWMHHLNRDCSFFEAFEVWNERLRNGPCRQTFWKRIVYADRQATIRPERFKADDSRRWCWTDTPHEPVLVQKGEPIATMKSRAG
ncbi:MAG: ATP-grasp domain-containing protein [Planctomycetota bacterium]